MPKKIDKTAEASKDSAPAGKSSLLTAKMTRDIDIKGAELKDLVDWYNENSGSVSIKKFKDRATAEARCAELKMAISELSNGASKPAAVKAQKKETTGAEGEEKPGKRGKKSAYSGKFIYIKTEGKKNPRREGTNGHNSFSLIKEGMTYEEYLEAGGRGNDFDWDVKKGYVEAVDKKK